MAEQAATAASELFCALCTKRPAMLLDLLRTYGLVGPAQYTCLRCEA